MIINKYRLHRLKLRVLTQLIGVKDPISGFAPKIKGHLLMRVILISVETYQTADFPRVWFPVAIVLIPHYIQWSQNIVERAAKGSPGHPDQSFPAEQASHIVVRPSESLDAANLIGIRVLLITPKPERINSVLL